MRANNWKWFGHAGHFICADKCRFHLCTLVGKHLVSTVGELWPERRVREIHAQYAEPKWLEENQHLRGDSFDNAYMKKFGFDTVGCDRKYETMVFKVTGEICTAKDCNCGLPVIDASEIDFSGYNDAGSATKGHYALCKKWASKQHTKMREGER